MHEAAPEAGWGEGWKDGKKGGNCGHVCPSMNGGLFTFSGLVLNDEQWAFLGFAMFTVGARSPPVPWGSPVLRGTTNNGRISSRGSLERMTFQQQGARWLYCCGSAMDQGRRKTREAPSSQR